MKKINPQKLLLITLMAIAAYSCNKQQSSDGRIWEADQDLSISTTGDYAIKAFRASATKPRDEIVFIDTFSNGKSLRAVVDRTSFVFLGSSFYKDRYHVYNHYDNSDGGTFVMEEEADPNTFVLIGDCHAKDKNYVYLESFGILEAADYKTFKTRMGIGCVAKDKNGIYNRDQKIDSTASEFKSIARQLDQ